MGKREGTYRQESAVLACDCVICGDVSDEEAESDCLERKKA